MRERGEGSKPASLLGEQSVPSKCQQSLARPAKVLLLIYRTFTPFNNDLTRCIVMRWLEKHASGVETCRIYAVRGQGPARPSRIVGWSFEFTLVPEACHQLRSPTPTTYGPPGQAAVIHPSCRTMSKLRPKLVRSHVFQDSYAQYHHCSRPAWAADYA